MSLQSFANLVDKNKISYVGIFFNKEMISEKATQGERLERIIDDPHITIAFRPDDEKLKKIMDFFKRNPNAEIKATITRYGNNGKTEGFFVSDIHCENGASIPYFGAEQKHITISVGNGGKPVDTGFMDFDQNIESFTIEGKVGIFMNDRTVIYEPKLLSSQEKEIENVDIGEDR